MRAPISFGDIPPTYILGGILFSQSESTKQNVSIVHGYPPDMPIEIPSLIVMRITPLEFLPDLVMNTGSGNGTSIALGCWTNDDVVSVAVSSTREMCDWQPQIRVIEPNNKQTHWLCLMIVLLKGSKLTTGSATPM